MSTTDKKHGFVPVKHMTGGTIRSREYHVDSSNTPGIFVGDLVILESDGNIAAAAAAQGVNVIGVAIGTYDVNRTPTANNYLAASTEGYVQVVDDPMVIFRVQEDGVGTSGFDAHLAIGHHADHVAGTGSTTTGISGHTVNSDSTDEQLECVGLYETSDNAWTDTYTEVLVLINEHHYKAASASI